jgi:hypothetical protein
MKNKTIPSVKYMKKFQRWLYNFVKLLSLCLITIRSLTSLWSQENAQVRLSTNECEVPESSLGNTANAAYATGYVAVPDSPQTWFVIHYK